MIFEPTNEWRAETATQALEAFQLATRTDDEDAVPDLLCNLMHYCKQEGIDFPAMLERAQSNFEAELVEAGEV